LDAATTFSCFPVTPCADSNALDCCFVLAMMMMRHVDHHDDDDYD
jgi:hypothetical protein